MRHGILLFVTGVALGTLSWVDLPWTFPLVWLGFDFVLVGAAHVSIGARISGKTREGLLPLWSKLLFLPYNLYLSLVWHLAVRGLSREDAYNEVNSDLILARRLLPAEVPAEVAAYVDLTAELEDPAAIRAADNYLCFPILDAGVPAINDLQRFIADLPTGKVLVHCAQGHGRTGTFALALLLQRGQVKSVEEGLSLLQQVRPGIMLSKVQRRFIAEYLRATM